MHAMDAHLMDVEQKVETHKHVRNDILDFFSTPFWGNIPDKPSTFPPSAHANTHQSGGSDALTGNLDANARVGVMNAGTLVGTRRRVNFIAGTNVSLNAVDDATNEKVDVTISAPLQPHNLLSDAHADTQPTLVQRGMLIVGQLIGTVIRWAGLALGAAGKFLKSTGTDVVWGDVDWTEVQNKPATFPPSAHTHVKADITDFAHTHPPSEISPQGSGSGLDADTVDGQHASAFAPASHTHSAADIAAGQVGANTGGGDFSFPGKVGIGTPTPQKTLSVVGEIRVEGVIGGGGVVAATDAPSGKRASFSSINNVNNYIQMEIMGSAESGTLFGLPLANLAYIRVMRISGTTPFAIGTQQSDPLIFATSNAERMRIDPLGRVAIGTTAPTARLHVVGATGYNQLRLQTPYTPTSSADPNGQVGDIAWDDNYIYVKTSTGWKRAALSAF